MPTEHTRITDVFGYRPRRRRAHYGLDIKVYVGDTIRAAFDGKVRIVKNQVVADMVNMSLSVMITVWKRSMDICPSNWLI